MRGESVYSRKIHAVKNVYLNSKTLTVFHLKLAGTVQIVMKSIRFPALNVFRQRIYYCAFNHAPSR